MENGIKGKVKEMVKNGERGKTGSGMKEKENWGTEEKENAV